MEFLWATPLFYERVKKYSIPQSFDLFFLHPYPLHTMKGELNFLQQKIYEDSFKAFLFMLQI